MKLQSPQSGRAVIDIAATVQKLKDVISELLPAHALNGCDTVAMCHCWVMYMHISKTL